jgi:hypothetical protein
VTGLNAQGGAIASRVGGADDGTIIAELDCLHGGHGIAVRRFNLYRAEIFLKSVYQ